MSSKVFLHTIVSEFKSNTYLESLISTTPYVRFNSGTSDYTLFGFGGDGLTLTGK